MGIFTGGGSQVGSAQINDGSIVNADVNAAADIAQTKLAGSANGDTDLVAFETTAGATHALTTVANQRVLVIAKGRNTSTGSDATINLKYNGVVKDSTVTKVGSSQHDSFCLMYTEVPGAATQNITVDGGNTLNDIKIFVVKMKGTA